MPLRTRIFVFTGIIVLLILGISVFLVFLSKKNKPAAEQTATETGAEENVLPVGNEISVTPVNTIVVTTTGQLTVKQPTSEEQEKNAARQLAKIFVERYGTYSTDNNFQNLRELENLSSAALWQKISAPMKKTPATTTEFLGVTTRVISASMDEWRGDSAKVALKAIRTEEKTVAAAVTKQLEYSVELVKIGKEWLVSAIKWK